MPVERLDHVQLAMPRGGEQTAIDFYEGVLGIPEVPKPPHLAVRGGCWFESDALKVHLGVEDEFRPARKAHPAFLVDDVRAIASDAVRRGHRVVDDEPLEGYDRVYVDDPFGNRIELLQPAGDWSSVPQPVDVEAVFDSLDFLADRTPGMADTDVGWAAELASYRDGGIFAVHYAGESEWERHPQGDEIVMVMDGSTTMTLLIDDVEQRHTLTAMQMVVVPRGTWHRFETPEEVKVLAVTPQPTDHRVDHPDRMEP